MRDILAWVVTVELLGVVVLPLLRVFFENRRDAALLSRPLGLALVAYGAWVLTLIGFPFERGVLLIVLVALGALGFVVHRGTRESFPAPFWASDEKRAALLFWASAGVFLVVRAAVPEILGQEKFMDLAFLNSLTRNTNMPPVDPWMSGLTINYYYWGYVLAAAATKIASVSTLLSYNLALATFAGYSFVAAACLGLRLSKGRWAAGIAGAVATIFAGNLVGAFDGWGHFLALLPGGRLGHDLEYFHASRVIASGDTINEFPFFTFFQADLHPHLLGFPYFIAAFAVGHCFLVREPAASAETTSMLRGFVRRWWPTALLALTGGTAIAANLWTLPAIGILTVAVCLLRKTRGRELPEPGDAILGSLGGLLLLFVAYQLWLPYERSFSLTHRIPQAHGVARNTMTSGLIEFLGVWGILFAVGLAAVWPRTGQDTAQPERSSRDLTLAATAAISVLAALLTKSPALAPILFLILLTVQVGWQALRQTHDADDAFAGFLLLLGLAMVAGCEFVHFRDNYGEKLQRMNTIFKFYHQAWPLIAIPAVVLAERRWRETPAGGRRRALAVLLAASAFAAFLYPAAAMVQRIVQHFQHAGPWTLDARPALTRRNPADAAAIAWLERNVHGGAVLLEASGDPYSEYARMSTHTGIPTVMGWRNHEDLWRENDPEVEKRAAFVKVFYTTRDERLARKIADEYHVSHVVLGELESRTYPNADGVATFSFLEPVFPGATSIFRVATPPPKTTHELRTVADRLADQSSMEPSAVRSLSGWGRFPVESCRIFRPERRAALEEILGSGAERSFIARGLGRSYGDAALNANGGVILFERLNRLIAFDPATGVLECEAGVSLAEILDSFLPRGYFLPVTPGTKFVTLGGAIAHDVHGKNHHRVGTISNFVLDFRLLTTAGDLLTCSPAENADVFWATVGGAGLTGLLLSARIRLQRVETAYVLVDFLKVSHFEEAIAAMAESDHLYEFSVAWIDCLAGGRDLGRSILMRANPAARSDLPAGTGDPLSPRSRAERSVPFDFPPGLLNPTTVRAFNSLFYGFHRTVSGRLADVDSFFYPLDSIRDWNRMYGRRGFVQYQVVFPMETSRMGLAPVLERVAASGRGSFLGVLKRFGNGNPGLLSFPLPGYTLALDLPVNDGLVPFLRDLDALVLRHGGRVYLAKDAVTTPESFAAMYPRLQEFRELKARLDPENRLSSSQARRVGIDRS